MCWLISTTNSIPSQVPLPNNGITQRLYQMQQLFLWPLESLKCSRILGPYFSKYKSYLLLKAPSHFCLTNCTASSYFSPPSVTARVTSTGTLPRPAIQRTTIQQPGSSQNLIFTRQAVINNLVRWLCAIFKMPVENMDAFFVWNSKSHKLLHTLSFVVTPYFFSSSVTLFKATLVGLCVITNLIFLCVTSIGAAWFIQATFIQLKNIQLKKKNTQ